MEAFDCGHHMQEKNSQILSLNVTIMTLAYKAGNINGIAVVYFQDWKCMDQRCEGFLVKIGRGMQPASAEKKEDLAIN